MSDLSRRLLFAPVLLAPALVALMLAGCSTSGTPGTPADPLGQKYDQLSQSLGEPIATGQGSITRNGNVIKIVMNNDTMFPAGDAHIGPTGTQILGTSAMTTVVSVAGVLAEQPQFKVVVNGYSDGTAPSRALVRKGISSSKMLSQKQADAVAAVLTDHGLAPAMVTAQGLGTANPVASNDSAFSRSKNRRIEILVGGS